MSVCIIEKTNNPCRLSAYAARKKRVVVELTLGWNQIEPSLRNTYEKLKKLGYTYSNGKVNSIENDNK